MVMWYQYTTMFHAEESCRWIDPLKCQSTHGLIESVFFLIFSHHSVNPLSTQHTWLPYIYIYIHVYTHTKALVQRSLLFDIHILYKEADLGRGYFELFFSQSLWIYNNSPQHNFQLGNSLILRAITANFSEIGNNVWVTCHKICLNS